jgi:hypothetical protein
MSDQRASPAARFRAALSERSSARTATLVAAGLVAVAVLATLRNAVPQDDARTGRPHGTVVRFTPSPSMSPRGDLPSPVLVDKGGNRVIGHVPLTGAEPGEAAVLLEVDKVLDWYCPEATARSTSIRRLNGWLSVEATTRPRPGQEIVLSMMWTGSWYRWQGRYDQLDKCW